MDISLPKYSPKAAKVQDSSVFIVCTWDILLFTIGRIGGITAILSQDLSTFWPPLQLIIFGIISIIAGILAAQFPETRNDKLPEKCCPCPFI
jgi:hypothetical protein